MFAIFIMHPDGFVINTWVFIGIFYLFLMVYYQIRN